MTTKALLTAVSAPATGAWVQTSDGGFSVVATGITSAGVGAATVVVDGSHDGATDVPLGTIVLTLGTTVCADGFGSGVPYRYVRARLTVISGTGASVGVTLSVVGLWELTAPIAAPAAPGVPATVPAVPDRADRATFSARAVALFDYIKNAMGADLVAFAANCYNNAAIAFNAAGAGFVSEANAAASALACANNAAAAAASAGAALWVSGATYAAGVATRSSVDQRIYIKITDSTGGAVDPSANATDWRPVDTEMPTVVVDAASAGIVSARRYLAVYAGVVAFAAPTSPADGAEFCVVPGNSLLTNTVDFGSATVLGPNGATLTGVMRLDVGQLRVRFVATIGKWVML